MIEKQENIKIFSFPRGVWFGVEKWRQRLRSLNKFNFMPYQIFKKMYQFRKKKKKDEKNKAKQMKHNQKIINKKTNR